MGSLGTTSLPCRRAVRANWKGGISLVASFVLRSPVRDLLLHCDECVKPETGPPVLTTRSNAYKFTGKERDSESNLDYFGARHNSSAMGRFMSPDPKQFSVRTLSNPQKWNKYTYTLNSPLRFIDPDGFDEKSFLSKLADIFFHLLRKGISRRSRGTGHQGPRGKRTESEKRRRLNRSRRYSSPSGREWRFKRYCYSRPETTESRLGGKGAETFTMGDENTRAGSLNGKNSSVTDQHWLLKKTQRRLFAYAALGAVLICILALAIDLIPDNETTQITQTLPAKILGVALGLIGAPTVLWLWVGMAWYWLRLDSSPRRQKIAWFLVLLMLNWIGAIAYYFVVFRRAQPGRADGERVLNAFPILLSFSFFGAIPFLYIYPTLATSRIVGIILFTVGLLVVLPTGVVLLAKLCRYGLQRTGGSDNKL
jgi:RHS repeat-associated protein